MHKTLNPTHDIIMSKAPNAPNYLRAPIITGFSKKKEQYIEKSAQPEKNKSDVISENEYEILANTIISGLSQYLPSPNSKDCCTCHNCKKRRNKNKPEKIKTIERACIFQSRQDDTFLALPYIENYTECNEYIGDNSTAAITMFSCPRSDMMTYVNKKNAPLVVNILLNFDIINTKTETACTFYSETCDKHNNNKIVHNEQDFIIPISSVHNLLYMGTNIQVPANGVLSVKYELSTTIKLHSYNLFIVEI